MRLSGGRGSLGPLLVMVAEHFVLSFGCGLYLSIEEDEFPLELLPLGNKVSKFLLVLLALGAEENISLDKLVPLPFELFFPLKHLVFDFLLISRALQLVQLLLGIDQLLFVLLQQGLLLTLKMLMEF